MKADISHDDPSTGSEGGAAIRRLVVLAAPSGAGKTTIAHRLLERHVGWRFSVSATTRPQRQGERQGIDYHFLDRAEFERRIAEGDLVEYEEVFGNLYGTLRSEIRQAMAQESFERMIFDVDVKGALSLRRAFPDDTFLCFIAPPSKEILGERLRARKTETPESIAIRLARVDMEMAVAHEFDAIVVNDLLERAVMEIEGYVERGMPRRDAR